MGAGNQVIELASNVLVCQRCWDQIYPDGHESITLGFIGSRVCTCCARMVTSKDSYGWMKINTLKKRVQSLLKRLKSVEDNLHERVEDWNKLDDQRLARIKELEEEIQGMYEDAAGASV